MKDIIDKLKVVEKNIAQNKKELGLFVLIARVDMESKWDIIISADWINENNYEKDLVFVIDELKKVFEENLDFLAKIVLLKQTEKFVQNIAGSIAKRITNNEEEIRDLKMEDNLVIGKLYVIKMSKNFPTVKPRELKVTKEENFDDSAEF